MALTKEEQQFIDSIKSKIEKYDIKVTLKDCIKVMNGVQVYTTYNDDTTELVDSAIEVFLIKNSFSYFLNRYCRVDIPGIGTVPMEPYYFQTEMSKEITNYRKIVLDKTRQCLTKNNYIKTNKGYISIKDVEPGLEIETLNEKNEIVKTLIENFYIIGKRNIIKIYTESGSVIEATDDHEIFTKNGLKKVGKLNINDELVTAINNGNFSNEEFENDYCALLYAYYFFNGIWNSIIFNKNNINEKKIERFKEKLKQELKLKNIDIHNFSFGDLDKTELYLFNDLDEDIVYFLEKNELLNIPKNKRILTNKILNLNKKQLSLILEVFFNLKGYVKYKKGKYVIELNVLNKTIAKQLEYILKNKYGILCSVIKKQNHYKILVKDKNSILKMKNELNIIELKDIELDGEPENKIFFYDKIIKIKKLKKKKTVYDITTSSSNFLTNNILVHNCGMSTVFALYAFWRTHFFEAESIDVVSTKQSKAQQFVKKIFPTMNSLPDWMKTPIKSLNQQKVVFAHKNGSSSEIISESQSETAGRGDSLSVLILDEVAFYQSEKMVRQIVASAQPTLSKTGGQMILISCVTKDTYINTNNGLQQVEDYIPDNCTLGYNHIVPFEIDGIEHKQKTDILYDSGITPVKKIHLNNGNVVEVSEIHPFYIIDESSPFPYFKISKEIKVGNYAIASCREKTFGNINKIYFNEYIEQENNIFNVIGNNIEITKEIAYIIGLIIANGIIDLKNNKITILLNNKEIEEILSNINNYLYTFEIKKTKKTTYAVLKYFMIDFFKSSIYKNKCIRIDKKILQLSRENIASLLRGIFDVIGYSSQYNGNVFFETDKKELAKQVVMLLDMFGIQIENINASVITENVENKNIEKIYLNSYFSKIFYEKIGFNVKSKQKNYRLVQNIKYNFEQIYPKLNKWIYDNLIMKNENLIKDKSKLDYAKSILSYYDITRKDIKNILDYFEKELEETEEYKKLLDFYEKDWYLIEIKKIEDGINHTYDFVIPKTKSFYANGVITHNTPNGTSGRGAYYYEQVVAARAGEKGTKYIEIDWWEIPDDPRIKGPKKGFNDILWKAIKEGYYYNKAIKQKYKKFFEPIAREKIHENEWLSASYKDLGDVTYRQEVLHDFVVSGDKVFNEEVLKKVEEKLKEPIRVNKIGSEQIEGYWVWKDPIPGHRYVASVDISSGTGSDYSSIEVIDASEYEQVAEYKGFISTPNFSRLIKKVARIYNEAYVIIESNSIGEAIFNGVYYDENDPYNNVYKQKKVKNGVTRYTGWQTDVKTRKLIANEFIDWITVDELWEQIKIYSKRLWLEMNTWVWTSGNKPEHAQGCHDDNIMAFAIGLYNRNKALVSGESFIITDKGETLSIDDKKIIQEPTSVITKGFDIVSSDDDDSDSYESLYGVSKEDYEWLLK